MSCPLSAVLNDGDENPLITSNISEDVGRPLGTSTRVPPAVPLTPISLKATPASHDRPAVRSSLEKGNPDLHGRKKPNRAAMALPSPAGSHFSRSQHYSSHKHGVFNRLLNYPELIFEMASHLDVDDLLILYSISRHFHTLANSRFTTMMVSQATRKAPESSSIFPFRCYRSLCLRDPAMRRNDTKTDFQIRHIPGFQWLKMVLFREDVVNNIVSCLEKECLMLPAATTLTIKKIWFFMDLSTNKLRDGLVRNPDYWPEQDLYLAHLFITKLDMLFTNPLTGNADLGLRKMLLAQRSLSTLSLTLQRKTLRNSYEMLKMLIAYNYTRSAQQRQLNEPIFGVPPNKVGMLQWEGWGRNVGTRFHQIDEVLVWECVRRGLDLPAHLLDMVLYGFVDKRTGLDVWTREQKRRWEERLEMEWSGGGGEEEEEHEDDTDFEGLGD
ncbi:MAG: hypothetical protein Q9178_004890 [Gyalolechia marmorata]